MVMTGGFRVIYRKPHASPISADDYVRMAVAVWTTLSAQNLPPDVAVLCPRCHASILLLLFVGPHGPKRQVTCPNCAHDVVLRDPW